MVGLKAALDFFHTIGPSRIYQRIHELARRVRDCVRKYPQLRLTNASADPFYAGMVSFEPAKGDLRRVVHAAIVNCLSSNLDEQSSSIRVVAFGKFFMTLPIPRGASDMYVEMVGLVKPDGGTSTTW